MKKNEFRKELVLILVLLCTTIAYAQKNDSSFMVAPADSTKDISLTQRVDSLEHELSYIKLSYELYTLNNDLSIFNTAGVTSFFLPNMPKKPFRFGFLDCSCTLFCTITGI